MHTQKVWAASLVAACIVMALLLLAPTPIAHANTIMVRAYGDGVADATRCPGSNCRLRDAIAAANNGDTITFSSVGHSITLNQGELNINKNLTIVGNGAVGDIVIDANSSSRIFNIVASTTATLDTLLLINGKPATGFNGGAIRVASTATLNLNNIAIENNQVQGSGDVGGAIYNLGTLNITNFAFFMNNQTADNGHGGAIYNNGTATLTGTVYADGSRSIWFSGNGNSTTSGGGTLYNNGTLSMTGVRIDNSSAQSAGAIFNNGATLTIDKSLIVGNHATGTPMGSDGVGGGIYHNSGTLTISDSSILSNTAATNAGGIYNFATTTIHRSLIYGNSARFGGGGIDNFGGMLTMVNSTISTNSATSSGGGIANYGTVELNNLTITKNIADSDNDGTGDGGGVWNATAGTVSIKNSIIAGNFDTPNNGGTGTIAPDCSGALSSAGYNLLRINAGCTGLADGVNGDKVGTLGSPRNAFLADLADNGGPTLTHALNPNSPAIDAGNPATPGSGGLACARLDQRSYPRNAGRCDMGAFERVFLLFLPLIVK
jgi:hypothetical protein